MGNLFIYLIIGIFKVIGGIFQILFSSIKAIFGWIQSSNKNRTSNFILNALYGMQKQIQAVDKTNDEMLRITGNTFATLNDNVPEKADVQQQLDYCNQLKKELSKADKKMKDIKLEIVSADKIAQVCKSPVNLQNKGLTLFYVSQSFSLLGGKKAFNHMICMLTLPDEK